MNILKREIFEDGGRAHLLCVCEDESMWTYCFFTGQWTRIPEIQQGTNYQAPVVEDQELQEEILYEDDTQEELEYNPVDSEKAALLESIKALTEKIKQP
jgi:hypothetical protein